MAGGGARQRVEDTGRGRNGGGGRQVRALRCRAPHGLVTMCCQSARARDLPGAKRGCHLAPSWVQARLQEHQLDHYLVLLDNPEYMGNSDGHNCSLSLACFNGQTNATQHVPRKLRPSLDGFQRWTPPGTDYSAIVHWHDAVGRGSNYSVSSVWFGEDEGAEARPSACNSSVIL